MTLAETYDFFNYLSENIRTRFAYDFMGVMWAYSFSYDLQTSFGLLNNFRAMEILKFTNKCHVIRLIV